ncbi:MAG TPA: PD-(D/E)XK nuclease family protein [Candidatus Nanoarchaeia archaeon]|nr:PD-(D/E)XK nuclease family protein [Candidatus Nanoarchaeia archaeon]
MPVFSNSRLSTFEQCKLKYRFRYIDKIIPDIEKTIESHLGNAVHKTLEWLYNNVQKGFVPTIDETVSNYTKNWDDDFEEEIPVVKKNLSVKDYFNKGVEFLINYYLKHKPFNDNTIAVEKEIMFDLDKDGNYKIRGFIDRLVYNLETGEYEVHDYKTSGNLPSQEKFDNDRQLALYSIAIKELFGEDKKVILVWHYLSFNKRIHSQRTDEQLKRLREETIDIIKKIESTKEFPPTKSALCGWCEFKNVCPAWGNKPPEKQMRLDGKYYLGNGKREK